VAVDQARAFWPLEMEILEEVLGYLAVLPVERRQAIVSRAVDQLGPGTNWLLRALLHDEDRLIQKLALDELVRLIPTRRERGGESGSTPAGGRR